MNGNLSIRVLNIWLVAIFAMIINSSCVLSAEPEREKLEACGQKNDFEARARCIADIVLESENQQEKRNALNFLMSYWRQRDGGMGFVLSDIFLDVLQDDPNLFLTEMTNNQSEFDEWLDRLGDLSFTWHLDPPSPLPAKRLKIIESLRNYPSSSKEVERLRMKLLSRLESITPRQID